MLAGVLVQHHTTHRLPWPLEPVRPALLQRQHQTRSHQHRARPRIATLQPMLTLGELMEMAHVEPVITLAIELRYPGNLRIRCTPLRYTSHAPILQAWQTPFLIPLSKAKKMPLTATQYHRCLLTIQSSLLKII